MIAVVTISVWAVIGQSSLGRFLTVAFLDVGQGDAILISTPSGRQVLLDVGPGRNTLTSLGQIMPFFDRSLDLVVFSHGDSDHIGAWSDIHSRYQVDYLLAGRWLSPATEKNPEAFLVSAGTRINLDHGIKLDVIEGGDSSNKNNADSLMVRLTYGSTTFLLAGDAVAKEEWKVINQLGRFLGADVLKVSHHGSKTSTGTSFLNFVRPQHAVISVGANNRYGHPTDEVLDRLARVRSEVLRTDQLGTITFYSDGKKVIKK